MIDRQNIILTVLSSHSIISSCESVTHDEIKACRCRECIQNGEKPIETPYKVLTGSVIA